MPGKSSFVINEIEDIIRELHGLEGAVGHNKYTVRVEFTLEFDKTDEVKRQLGFINHLLNEGLSELARAAGLAIIATIGQRAASAEIGPYSYMSFPTPFHAMAGIGDYGEVQNKGAELQFYNLIVPMIQSSQPIPISTGGRHVEVGIISLTELSTVKITDAVGEHADIDELDDLFDTRPDAAIAMGSRDLGVDIERQATGTPGDDYIDTWQIVEFGTGQFAQHPFWGWGPRLEGYSKVENSPHPGAWWIRRGKLMGIGQAGGHFLDDPRNGAVYAQQEILAATRAINLYFNRILA